MSQTKYRTHYRVGRESNACNGSTSSPAFQTTDRARVTCPRCQRTPEFRGEAMSRPDDTDAQWTREALEFELREVIAQRDAVIQAFEAFVKVVDRARDYTPGRGVMEAARAAIARARGES